MIPTHIYHRIINRIYWSPSYTKALRIRAAADLRFRDTPGVTVVIVNWNSLDFLRVTLRALELRSPDARIIVVDNGSEDGSPEFLRESRPRIRAVLAPSNLKHSRAMDIGFLLARTRYVVALDVDAFPIRNDWLDVLIQPLQEGARVSGAHIQREYVHPCCLAMERAVFVKGRHTFGGVMPSGMDLSRALPPEIEERLGTMYFDCGERISHREQGHLNFLEPTSIRGPGALGTVFGDIVYHNFYAVRHLRENASPEMLIDGVVSRSESLAAWAEATDRYVLGTPA